EAEGEQRDPERHLPGRDRAKAPGDRRHGGGPSASDRRKPIAMAVATTTTRMAPRRRPVARSAEPGRAGAPGATPPDAGGRAGACEAPGASVPGVPTGPDQPVGRGPAGAGWGPFCAGRLAPRLISQPSSNPVAVTPSAALNASSSVTPFAYDRMSATSASLPYVFTR